MSKGKKVPIEMGKKVFDIENEPMPRGAWWWWFWLFFFNNPKNPDKPRQLMILWSTKNVRKIKCNELDINVKLPINKKSMDGAVAAWYFDGEKMHHNFLLEQCDINVSENNLTTNSKVPTIFSVEGKKSIVKIGKTMEFVADENGKHNFKKANHHSNNFIGDKGYSIIKVNHVDISGKVDKKPIKGTAYFQRVFVNAPAIPWYWGIFHFDSGAVMTYTNQLVLGKSIKKDISFFDGKDMHNFKNMKVVRSDENDLPVFTVTGENDINKISFSVVSYAHSSWTFRKKSRRVIPNKLVYNEYPSTVTDLVMTNKKTGKKITSKELGRGVGNAEHSTGLLF